MRISQDTTIDAPIRLSPGSAGFTVDAGVTLTINGPISAPVDEQIFFGAGDVRFGAGQSEFRPEWFGVRADDDATASEPA